MYEHLSETLQERHAEMVETGVETILHNAACHREAFQTQLATEMPELMAKIDAGDTEEIHFHTKAEGKRSVSQSIGGGFLGDDLPEELRAIWHPHLVFEAHDYGQISIFNWSHSKRRVFKGDKELQHRWLRAQLQAQELTALIFEGVALNLDPKALEAQNFNAGNAAHMVFESLFFRNFKHSGKNDHSQDWEGKSLSDRVSLQNNIPRDLNMHGQEGAFTIVLYNLIKNPMIFVHDALNLKHWERLKTAGDAIDTQVANARAKGHDKGDHFNDLLKWQIQKDEGPRWIEQLGDGPLEIVADYVETPDAHIIHVHDNGPGLDFTRLKRRLHSLVSTHGIEYLKNSGSCPSELADELEQWENSPYYFGDMNGSTLTDLTKISSLTGLPGHSGSGLWAMERLVQSTDGIALIGQGLGGKGGTYFALVFPKKTANDPQSVTADIRNRLTKGEFLPPADKVAA